jgi:hypothetical protein
MKFLRPLHVLLMFPLAAGSVSVGQENPYSLGLKGNFTFSSRLFPNIDALDEVIRSQYTSIENIFGFGIDFRRAIDDTRLEVGVSAEYLSAREKFRSRSDVVEDGFWAVPVELTGYFVIPFSSEHARLYIGGGVGAYWGGRVLTVGDAKRDVLDNQPGIGIHVLTGFQYGLNDWFALRSELKFRDIQFESTVLSSNNEPTRARIDVDGMVVDAAVVVRF